MDNVRCFGCGKMSHEREDGPSAEEAGQIDRWSAAVVDIVENDCYAAVLCWPCYWELDPDMWSNKYFYNQLNPVVPFEKLPKLDHDDADCWELSKYDWPL